MSDIPEEITELATEIYAAMRDGESEEATAKLSRALLSAEARGMERAAKIAEAEPELPGEPPQRVIDKMVLAGPVTNARAAFNLAKLHIAAAIRNGTEA